MLDTLMIADGVEGKLDERLKAVGSLGTTPSKEMKFEMAPSSVLLAITDGREQDRDGDISLVPAAAAAAAAAATAAEPPAAHEHDTAAARADTEDAVASAAARMQGVLGSSASSGGGGGGGGGGGDAV